MPKLVDYWITLNEGDCFDLEAEVPEGVEGFPAHLLAIPYAMTHTGEFVRKDRRSLDLSRPNAEQASEWANGGVMVEIIREHLGDVVTKEIGGDFGELMTEIRFDHKESRAVLSIEAERIVADEKKASITMRLAALGQIPRPRRKYDLKRWV